MNRVVFFAVCWFVAGLAWAQTPLKLSLSTDAEVSAGPALSSKETVAILGRSSLFEAGAQLQINSDGKYGADIANFSSSKSFFNNYFYLDQGYLLFRNNPLEFQVGRYAQKDAFESPYSLFLNSANTSAMGMRFRYEDQWFAYESRWIELNNRSSFDNADTPEAWRPVSGNGGFPDRGANIKTFLFKFGALKVGLQDAGVYTKRNFDLEYFASPMPEYFTQYVKNTGGRPWSTGGNENNLLGFFVDWAQPTYNLGLQVLIDDFSLHFLFPDQVPNNPWKAAWTFGGQFKTNIGRFGIYQAGALKYTFEPITASPGQEQESAYGYTYYPDVEYSIGGGQFRPLAITDNALGYQYGENSLAIRLTYDNDFGRTLSWATYLEVVLSGSNSPANPWQDATSSSATGGTHWLDDPVLQRSLLWSSQVRWSLGDWNLFTSWKLGYVGNVLGLRDPFATSGSTLDTKIKIFSPTGQGTGVANLVVGVSWNLDVSALQRSLVRP